MRLGPTARGLTTLYSTTILLGSGHGMLFPIIPLIASEFGISGGISAQTVTAFAAGRLLGQPLGGILIDRFGTRPAVTVGPLVIGVSVLIGAVTPWFWPLLVALFIAGAADSGWMLGREVAGVDLVRPEQRGRLMSGFMGFHGVGMGLGALLSGVLGDEIGFRPVFYVYTGLAAGVFTTLAAGTLVAFLPVVGPATAIVVGAGVGTGVAVGASRARKGRPSDD